MASGQTLLPHELAGRDPGVNLPPVDTLALLESGEEFDFVLADLMMPIGVVF